MENKEKDESTNEVHKDKQRAVKGKDGILFFSLVFIVLEEYTLCYTVGGLK